MVWDLGGALLKKQENETARLADFEFRLRVRTMRLLAAELGRNADEMAARVALKSDAAIRDDLVAEDVTDAAALAGLWAACCARARAQLVAEHGDPSPHRLA
ncbi:hypothetical protein FHS96_000126 [Sphingomonas zeicaulis]|uniref:hypothetical protein n=1 Tax=Sphingomonas zeicaulis TaxID=1632740 RepID=UPI003D1A3FC6